MRRALLATCIVLLGYGPARAESANAGTTGFGFLKLSACARPSALGGAFVAVEDDLVGAVWNPALAATVGEAQVGFSYTDYLVDTQAGYVGLSWPAGRGYTVNIAANYLSYGDMVKTTGPDLEPLGTFSASDLAVQCTVGRFVLKRLAVGAAFKAIYSRIDTYRSDAYALDVGLFYIPPVRGLCVGAAAMNPVGAVRRGYTSERKDDLPVDLKVGLSHQAAHLPLLVVGQVTWPNDNRPYYAVGGELSVARGLFLRAGYTSLGTDIDDGGRAGWSLGGGATWRSYRFDYAYSSHAALGDVHRIAGTRALPWTSAPR